MPRADDTVVKRNIDMHRLGVAGLTLLAALLAGVACEQSDQPASPKPTTLDVDTLRSMPYASGSHIADDEEEGVILIDAERVCPGYNHYTIQPLSTAELIDNQGNVVRQWRQQDSERWVRTILLPNGDLIAIGAANSTASAKPGTGAIPDDARYVARYNWNGECLWKTTIPAHHDITPLPEERYLTITLKRRMLPQINRQVETRDDQLTILNTKGDASDSLSIFDAIKKNTRAFPLARVRPSTLGGAPWVDLFHANSLQWIEEKHRIGIHAAHRPGNVLVCFRHQNRIAVFDWDEKRVVWSWGKTQLDGPHDAQVLPNGNILIFDNGLSRGWSRVIELDPDTEKIVWTYQTDPPTNFYTASKGSAQRLPNGNTLIAESDKGRAFEVTPQGEIVWEFINPNRVTDDERAAIVRMRRLPTTFVDKIIETNQ